MKAEIIIVFSGEVVSENVYHNVTDDQAKSCAEESLNDLGGQVDDSEWQVVNNNLQKIVPTEYHPLTEEYLDSPGKLVATIKLLSER